MSHIPAILTGAITGFFSGFTGVGGGAILVTMMVSFLKIPQHKAHGTSLAIIILGAFFGAITYAVGGWYNVFLTISLAIGSIFGVILGAKIMVRLPAPQLRRLFGIFLFYVSLSMLSKGVLDVGSGTPPLDPEFITSAQSVPFWLMVGFSAGVFAGILGIGGGLLMVPVMALGAGLDQRLVQGISLAVITITSIVGTYTHYKMGNVDVPLAVIMGPSAVLTAIAASAIASRTDPFWLTKIFGFAMLYFAFQFTFRPTARRPAVAPEPPPAAMERPA